MTDAEYRTDGVPLPADPVAAAGPGYRWRQGQQRGEVA